MIKSYLIYPLFVALTFGIVAKAQTVDNCGEPLVFETTPQRLVIHDMNMADMAFALRLQDRIVGLTGITGWYKASPEFNALRGDIPELAPKYPTVENLVAVEPDLFFAGWYYGMRPGGEVTPDTLAPFGIKTMILTESCVHLDKNRPEASMDLLFDDILRLGKVMEVETVQRRWLLAGNVNWLQFKNKPRIYPNPVCSCWMVRRMLPSRQESLQFPMQ